MAISVPFVFSPDTTILSSQVNANFTALAQGIGTIDHSNVGPAGFYASQIIPIDAASATFGGTLPYSFVHDVSVIANITASAALMVGPSTGTQSVIRQNQAQIQGPVQAIKSGGISLGTVAPNLTTGGSDVGTAVHRVGGKVLISIPSGVNSGSTTIVLTGDAVFTLEPPAQATWAGFPSVPGWAGGAGLYVSNQISTPNNVIQVNAYSLTGGSAVSTALLHANWEATGV